MDHNTNVMETEIKKVWTARIEYVAAEISRYEG